MANSSPTAPGDSVSIPSRLDALDDALVGLRRAQQRPGYRRRLLEGNDPRVELAMLRLLRVVQRAGKPPTIGRVAETLVVDPSTASRVVERAVAAGHLERQPCADDRRRARLHLTEAGRSVLDTVTDRRRQMLADVTRDWDDDDIDGLVELLAALQAGFEQFEVSS